MQTDNDGNWGGAVPYLPGRLTVYLPYVLAGLLGVAAVVMLTAVIIARSGNLAWDDVSYLAQGLNSHWQLQGNHDHARVLGQLLKAYNVTPKPPLLVVWISCGTLAFGPWNVIVLALWSSILPYAFLYLATFVIARSLSNPTGGCLAVVTLVASPLSLVFGAKVMVETLLSLWILLAVAFAAWLLNQPSPWRGMVLGTILALTVLTKLTFVLFLSFPAVYFAVAYARRFPLNRSGVSAITAIAGIVTPVIILAWPWYSKYGVAAFEFARYSSQFDEAAFGRRFDDPHFARPFQITRDVMGYPMIIATMIAIAYQKTHICMQKLRMHTVANDFVCMTLLGITNAVVLLLPSSYFETRFFLPIWPSMAVCLGLIFCQFLTAGQQLSKFILISGLLALGLFGSAATLLRLDLPLSRATDDRWRTLVDHSTGSFWDLPAILNRLIRQQKNYCIGNIGNCSYWNAEKLKLMNALQSSQFNCHIWRDLSALSAPELAEEAGHCDVLFVLDQDVIPPALEEIAPKLNRSYAILPDYIAHGPFHLLQHVIFKSSSTVGFSIYVRQQSPKMEIVEWKEPTAQPDADSP